MNSIKLFQLSQKTINNATLWVIFKLDLFHYDHHVFTQKFMDSLFSHMFIPALINRPTRLTSYAATVIDNIFTNCLSENGINGIILYDISEHLPAFAISSTKTVACKKEVIIVSVTTMS